MTDVTRCIVEEPAGSSRYASRVPTVLIVDDDSFARAMVRDAVSEAMSGHEVVEAADGAEALVAIEKGLPDLVFLDLLMPNKSGLDALPEIRRRAPSAKVVVVSSMETRSMVDAALQAGATGFIGKPFHPEEIAAAVRKAGF